MQCNVNIHCKFSFSTVLIYTQSTFMKNKNYTITSVLIYVHVSIPRLIRVDIASQFCFVLITIAFVNQLFLYCLNSASVVKFINSPVVINEAV